MRMVDLIVKKRNGGELSQQEIEFIIKGFVSGSIPDYQMSAFLMSVYFNGMTPNETAQLTMSMVYSGDTVDLSMIPGIKVDKHSTGGVADTTTLIVAPLVAACGGKVAKMSGRGLGHTGGTINKLESIPGLQTEIKTQRFIEIVKKTGLSVIGQSSALVPADKLIYALRDVTGTVESIPLIASSIMSKKIAAGADAIILDVKVGSGAFMQTAEKAALLAKEMVAIGKETGRKTIAIITDMNQPLGMSVGNALEVKEAVDALSGRIPQDDPLIEVCLLLGGYMLMLGGIADRFEKARELLKNAFNTGRGLEKFKEMILEQGGDASIAEYPEKICAVDRIVPVVAANSGFICSMEVQKIGKAAQLLGAGRSVKADVIDPAVGLVMKKRIGDHVEKDEPVALLHVNDSKNLNESANMLHSAIHICEAAVPKTEIIYSVIE